MQNASPQQAWTNTSVSGLVRVAFSGSIVRSRRNLAQKFYFRAQTQKDANISSIINPRCYQTSLKSIPYQTLIQKRNCLVRSIWNDVEQVTTWWSQIWNSALHQRRWYVKTFGCCATIKACVTLRLHAESEISRCQKRLKKFSYECKDSGKILRLSHNPKFTSSYTTSSQNTDLEACPEKLVQHLIVT